MTTTTHLRLFENQWVSSEDRLATDDDIRACVTLDGVVPARPNVRYVIGLDLDIRDDRTVAAVYHAERTSDSEDMTTGVKVVLDRMEAWGGTRERQVKLSDVEDWIGEAASYYYAANVRLDPRQAIGLMQRLRSRGARVEEFTFFAQSVGRLASTLHLLLRNHQLGLPDDPDDRGAAERAAAGDVAWRRTHGPRLRRARRPGDRSRSGREQADRAPDREGLGSLRRRADTRPR